MVFIFGVIGMNLFGRVKHQKHINAETNFSNIWNAHLLLFNVLTLDEWRGIMRDCAVQEPYCSEELEDCGSALAYIYFIVYWYWNCCYRSWNWCYCSMEI